MSAEEPLAPTAAAETAEGIDTAWDPTRPFVVEVNNNGLWIDTERFGDPETARVYAQSFVNKSLMFDQARVMTRDEITGEPTQVGEVIERQDAEYFERRRKELAAIEEARLAEKKAFARRVTTSLVTVVFLIVLAAVWPLVSRMLFQMLK